MAHAPCGCDLLSAAMRDPDAPPGALAEGMKRRSQWRCPVALPGHPGATAAASSADLRETPDFSPHEAIEEVRRLTGDRHTTCPMACVRDPDVHRVLEARRWRDSGHLDAIVPMPADAVLVEALGIVDATVSEVERELADESRTDAGAGTVTMQRTRTSGR